MVQEKDVAVLFCRKFRTEFKRKMLQLLSFERSVNGSRDVASFSFERSVQVSTEGCCNSFSIHSIAQCSLHNQAVQCIHCTVYTYCSTVIVLLFTETHRLDCFLNILLFKVTEERQSRKVSCLAPGIGCDFNDNLKPNLKTEIDCMS